ncbi:MAG: Rab family GTPase [Promethearchaeota archaeon]
MKTSLNIKWKFKVVICGPAAVGKTSIIQRFVHNSFSISYKITIGVDFLTKDVEYRDGEFARLTIWDIGGQERYNFLRESFFEKSDGALLIFDLTREKTFIEIRNWLEELRKYTFDKIPFIFVGNKSDLLADLGVVLDNDDIKRFAKKEGAIYVETSAKTGENIELAFLELTKAIIKSKSS